MGFWFRFMCFEFISMIFELIFICFGFIFLNMGDSFVSMGDNFLNMGDRKMSIAFTYQQTCGLRFESPRLMTQKSKTYDLKVLDL